MQRMIFLGASNLTLGLPLIFETLRTHSDGPLEVFTADGHGRSYGQPSRVLFRTLPGVTECRIWDDLASRPAASSQPLAVVTDVGNDLLYGAEVDTIAQWVETCVERLASHSAKVVMTELPVAAARRLSPARYYAARTMLFPTCRVPHGQMLERAEALNNTVKQIAERYGAVLVHPKLQWYGWDAIHIRRRHRPSAWREILSHWSAVDSSIEMKQPSLTQALRLWSRPPANRRIFGKDCSAGQPVLRTDNRTTLWMY